ncbi:putative methyltransferase [Candidatus Terasakiella magnetica]|uniref:Putative methyltransferase n=1 Tax=Candidatus Terasakiella magnetica TaxID=1867952 RepID=A0A1C3RIY4_9PROT|nr:16S rRNA (guanine(966)-N(2))-methyltransferase RsmD [Candidatus Terasakiella magnetica]SCA57225.1 putative methyltransferase [Candidatus Terasakiella magnetica]
MRIVGGKFKGRKLSAPEGGDTRPTSDRARESIFNILEHQSWGRSALRGKRVLDVFAGTGALGLEAFSRGAAHVTFMDNHEAAMKSLRNNAKGMGSAQEINAMRVDATSPPRADQACSLIFMDAPYKSGLNDLALKALVQTGWIGEGSLCIIEAAKKENWQIPDGFEELDIRKYGAAQVFFMKFGA